MDASFKTCMFGGFDRQDVVTFIEKTAEEHRTALEVLQTENDTLRRERDDAVAENDTLRLLAEEDARLRDDNTHLEQQVQALQQQLTAVQAENDALHPAGKTRRRYAKMPNLRCVFHVCSHTKASRTRCVSPPTMARAASTSNPSGKLPAGVCTCWL